jgi:hypothetical protein
MYFNYIAKELVTFFSIAKLCNLLEEKWSKTKVTLQFPPIVCSLTLALLASALAPIFDADCEADLLCPGTSLSEPSELQEVS